MELKNIPQERILEYKSFVIEKVKQNPFFTPSAIALRSFYRGFIEFRFTDARAIAEQTKQDYLAQNNNQ